MLKSWEKISDRDKLFKKFKKSRLHVDNYKESRNEVQKLIKRLRTLGNLKNYGIA